LPENTNCILSGVGQFLEQGITHEQKPSLIHYMELVDDNPDCDETMAQKTYWTGLVLGQSKVDGTGW